VAQDFYVLGVLPITEQTVLQAYSTKRNFCIIGVNTKCASRHWTVCYPPQKQDGLKALHHHRVRCRVHILASRMLCSC